jgi:uncharacterized membrane protein YkvA (DUF1232 family)
MNAAAGRAKMARRRLPEATMNRLPVLRAVLPDGFDAAGQARQFSEESLRDKLARFGRAAGREVVEKVLWLWFASRRPDVPAWARTTIYGALAYFVLPIDAIPDLLPLAGYSDDLGVLAWALLTISRYVDADVKRRTAAVLSRLFPAGSATPST